MQLNMNKIAQNILKHVYGGLFFEINFNMVSVHKIYVRYSDGQWNSLFGKWVYIIKEAHVQGYKNKKIQCGQCREIFKNQF